MMLGVVASDGNVMPPYFFPCGLKINTDRYLWVMSHVVKPWIDRTWPEDNVLWTQDSAPAHGATKTQRWCEAKLPDFISKELWPPSSPDCNPLDYAIWSYVEKRACATSHPSIESLKSSICQVWNNMPQEFVIKSCKSFRSRIEAVIKAEGGHIEGKRKKKS